VSSIGIARSKFFACASSSLTILRFNETTKGQIFGLPHEAIKVFRITPLFPNKKFAKTGKSPYSAKKTLPQPLDSEESGMEYISESHFRRNDVILVFHVQFFLFSNSVP